MVPGQLTAIDKSKPGLLAIKLYHGLGHVKEKQ